MSGLYNLLRPVLFGMDAEMAHALTIKAMRSGVVRTCAPASDPALEVTLWGHKFPNPVGLCAGFDKNGEVIGAAFGLGFGFVEAGTVTPKPQDGNPRPRIFRSPAHEAVINRMGFPNKGASVFKDNVEKFLSRKPRPSGVLGINIGMNKGQTEPAKDYGLLIRMLGPMADYLVVNISSPNTPGLRDLQSPEILLDLLGTLHEERRRACGDHPPPLLVKLAPDLSEDQQEKIAQALIQGKADGIILTNTTLSRPDYLPGEFASEKGGLSGAPVRDLSTGSIRNFYRLTAGQLPIIGAGGISSGLDAYEKIKAGASLVQIYSALVFKGPGLVRDINTSLAALLKQDGYAHITEAVGKGALS